MKALLIREIEQHHDLVGPVTVGVHIDLAAEDVDHRLHQKIVARRDRVLAAFAPRFVVVPTRDVILRVGERLSDHFLDAHARLRVLRGDAGRGAEVRRLRVFAEGKFDRPRCIGDGPFRDGMAPLPLHDLRLPADRVGRAVQDECGRRPAGELAIDVDVFVVQNVADPDHAGVRERYLVDASLDGGVAVCIDDAWHHELAGRVDDERISRHGDLIVSTDRGDLAAVDQDRAVLDLAMRDRQDRGVANDDVLRRGAEGDCHR